MMRLRFSLAWILLSLMLCGGLYPPSAFAQSVPTTAAQHDEAVGDRDAANDIMLQVSAGAALVHGNARNFALNLGTQFALREEQHGFLAEVTWVYGMAATRVDATMMMYDFGDYSENANNFTGRLRYDFFFDAENAFFLVGRVRRDPFANLSPRVQGQTGYLRNLLNEEHHRFWIELGADFSYDQFADGALDVGGGVNSTDRSMLSVRSFLGYSNKLNEVLTWESGLETLWVVARSPGDVNLAHLRFNWVNHFRSRIENWLQLSLDVTGRLDSLPPGQAVAWEEQGNQATQMFDFLTTLNLVGNFDLDGDTSAESEGS